MENNNKGLNPFKDEPPKHTSKFVIREKETTTEENTPGADKEGQNGIKKERKILEYNSSFEREYRIEQKEEEPSIEENNINIEDLSDNEPPIKRKNKRDKLPMINVDPLGEVTILEPKRVKHPILSRIIYFAIITAIFILCTLLKTNPKVSEFMTVTVNRYYIAGLSHVTDFVPISVFEILTYIFIIIVLIWLILLIKGVVKKNYARALKRFVNFSLFILTIATLYVATTSFAYNRQGVDIPQYSEGLTASQVNTITNYFIDEINTLSNRLERDSDGNVDMGKYFTFNELAKQMQEEYKRLDSPYFSKKTPLAKPIWNKHLLTEMQTTGITFSLTGEANVNPMIPAVDLAYTMAHELAHTKGVMRESDANLVALYICVTSSNDYIRYCGLFWGCLRLLTATNYTNTPEVYTATSNRLDAGIKKELSNNLQFWDSHNLLDEFQDWWNDLYLKINGVKDGVDSYTDTTDTNDTGTEDPSGDIVYTDYFSDMQRMLFHLYYND